MLVLLVLFTALFAVRRDDDVCAPAPDMRPRKTIDAGAWEDGRSPPEAARSP
jgi:hypothetical protein